MLGKFFILLCILAFQTKAQQCNNTNPCQFQGKACLFYEHE